MEKKIVRSFYGVGYNSAGGYPSRVRGRLPRSFIVWRSLIMRCYHKPHHEEHVNGATYKETLVCEEWHDYQVFKEWYDAHSVPGWELDKDILCPNIDVYSPDTCCIVPVEINGMFKKTKAGKELPQGVHLSGLRYGIPKKLSRICRVPAYYLTVAEAKRAYLYCKSVLLDSCIEKYKEQLPEHVVAALRKISKNFLEGIAFNDQ